MKPKSNLSRQSILGTTTGKRHHRENRREPSRTLNLLREYESRNVTYMAPDGSWPVVWRQAHGIWVVDAAGRRYLDLTAAFGVAAAGHANPRVVQAGQRQMTRLLHAMGDVHPHALKADLVRELSRLTFERWSAKRGSDVVLRGKTILGNSGFEAVEAALKTVILATDKPRIIAFEGAYHGLGYGAMNATHRQDFRSPFRRQLAEFADFVPYPTTVEALDPLEKQLRRLFRKRPIGAILVEPIQGRGGIRVPPSGFLELLRRMCDDYGALLVLDEIYTGFGRTGQWFACEWSDAIPDLICLGKALAGGFPLSACVGRAGLMDAAWPLSQGEAIHTSTFLGHPVGCAMALAQLGEIERLKLADRARQLGTGLLARLSQIKISHSYAGHARGRGLMAGIELRRRDGRPATDLAIKTVQQMLHEGYILLPEGEHSNVIGFTPPLVVGERHLAQAVQALQTSLNHAASS